LVALLGTAGCGPTLANQTRYAGVLSDCASGPEARATLVRVADHFSFAPSDGALVVPGTVAPDGSFAGSLRTDHAGSGRQGHAGGSSSPFTLVVTGRIEGDIAAGEFATPRCRATFRLSRIVPGLLPWK
jgi:hypothetical protein